MIRGVAHLDMGRPVGAAPGGAGGAARLSTAAHRTALKRRALSAPAQQALDDGLLSFGTVLDYGCGRGGDVDRLAAAGIDALGWDPHYRPDPPAGPADAVLCSYVLNVIDDRDGRVEAARRAWALARRVLVVAVRGRGDERHLRGRDHADGVVTSRGTFHHLFGSAELAGLLEEATGSRPVPVSPSLAYVFRDAEDSVAYLARRYGGADPAAADTGGELLAGLVAFLEANGRGPAPAESGLAGAAARAYGRSASALAAARSQADDELVARAGRRRAGDLLVLLSMARFHGGVRVSDLPPAQRADAEAFFGGARAALRRSEQLLAALGRPEVVRAAVRRSPVGKTTATALYVHADAEGHLPPLLRVYAGCAELVCGRPAGTTLVKLHHDRAAVSFLEYPEFDSEPHPRLSRSLLVDLRKRSASATEYDRRENRPLLHRKEEFLHPADSRAGLYRRLTQQEARAGLYAEPERIGLESGWQEVLDRAGRAHRGHRLVRALPVSGGSG
jgi:DNA phosphorothioation-associated putative methyltransferase